MSASTDPWYAEGIRFRCTGCGNCCRGPISGYVYVDEDEVEAMAAALEIGVAAFGRRYLRRVNGNRLSLTEQPVTRDCVFWADEVGCTIYDARPTQCRTFPFWPEVLASREAWDEEAESCPGMSAEEGKPYSRAEIDRISGGQRGTRRGRKRIPTV